MSPLDASPPPLRAETGRAAARRALAARFAALGLASAEADARILVCAACGIDHAALIRDPDEPLGNALAQLSTYADRRARCEPVSRILGRREFWGLSLSVNADVLDPRPETEELVGAVLDAIGARREMPLRLLDLGTGSGAILCALLREMPETMGVGIDRSPGACRTAAHNAAACGIRDRAAFAVSDWANALEARFDAVVSNPPYVTTAELATLDVEVRDYDPRDALDGGMDGLAPYRAIVPILGHLLRPGGIAAFECGTGQGESVAAMMRAAGLNGVTIHRDLAGHDRVILGRAAADAH